MKLDDEDYWAEYDGLQHAKHQLLKSYLGGWFPILTSNKGRVLYIDCNAGRGRHKSGQEGSPLLALNILLTHSCRDQILKNSEVGFIFFEANQHNYNNLCKELAALDSPPDRIHINSFHADYEEVLRSLITDIRSKGITLAPSFGFIDPYGFTISMELMNEILGFPGCELLINFMYRYIDMAIHKEDQAKNMDSLFGSHDWSNLVNNRDPDQRAKATIDLFSRQLNAKYVSQMYMRGRNKALKYVLLHASNHSKGRNLMKRAMWGITPDGSFTAYERNSPLQPVLISPEPDLKPLRQALWKRFIGETVRLSSLHEWLLNESYLEKHLHQILREDIREGRIASSGLSGKLVVRENPHLTFKPW